MPATLVRPARGSSPAQRRSRGDQLSGHSLRDPLVQRAVSVPQSGGKPLPEAMQRQMEGAMGQDFSSVRVHEGAHATQLGAVAFTQGENVHFAPGTYNPDSSAGQRLLGHELAHVAQQRAGQVAATGSVGGVALNDDPSLERAADHAADRAVQRMVEEEEKPAQRMVEEEEKPAQRMVEEEEHPTQRLVRERGDEVGARVI